MTSPDKKLWDEAIIIWSPDSGRPPVIRSSQIEVNLILLVIMIGILMKLDQVVYFLLIFGQ